jgi:transcription initiation factor TFIIB
MSSQSINRSETNGLIDSERPNRCLDCGAGLHVECGETFCPSCGTVVAEDHIDHGPEWNPYTERAKRRTGAPLTETLHDRGLSTDIGRAVDGNGNGLPAGTRRQFHRLRREHGRARFRSKAEQNMGHGFDEIRRIKGGLDLPDAVSERACAIFRAASRENLLLGRSIESMAAASVYAACRCYGLPRFVEEVGEYARVDADRVLGDYRTLKQKLALRIPPIRPRDLIPRIAATTGVSDRIRGRAHEFAVCAEETGIANGKKPSGVAAACVYHAAAEVGYPVTGGTTLTQADIAEVAGVTAVTLRNCWRALTDAYCP